MRLTCNVVGSGDFRKPNIGCFTWLLVITPYELLRQRGEVGKIEIQNIQFSEKKNPSLMLKEMRSLKC